VLWRNRSICRCRFDLNIPAQGEIPRSLGTLLEVHNVSVSEYQRAQQFPSQPSLERYGNLRAVTVLHVRRGLEPCLPALPLSVRMLTLDAGFGCAGCECDRPWHDMPVQRAIAE